ncbi:MAG: alkaline phosphatase family protein [Chlorobi bacterium]|nr:alkaline phosphatase family protein [Chlorobiota bacterium]
MRTVALLSLVCLMVVAKPRLVVLVCYDQLRGDRIDEVRPWLSQRGFLRLLRDGAVAERCMFDYATTVTAAGHSTIATGCNPARHGIVDNDFVIGGRALYATDDTVLRQPSPRLLLVPTLGDYLRRANPNSKIWSFSHKDRGAIFLGGHQPNGAFWLVSHVGLGTSAYYPPPPAWIQRFNVEHSPAQWAGSVWNKSLPSSAPADSVEWEGRFPGGERYFPHQLPGDTASELFWRAFPLTPQSVEWLFRAAGECIRAEQLGTDDIPDVLCISVSTTDLTGHLFGHDSREYAELLVACDRILADFVDTLDQRIGRDQYVLVLTSDHGAAGIPELARERGLDAGRILADTLVRWVTQWSTSVGAPSDSMPIVRYFFPPWIWLDTTAIGRIRMSPDSAAASLAQWIGSQRGIGIALTRWQIERGLDTGVVGLVRRSYRRDRCGDLAIYPRQWWIFGSTPAQHGTPYDYDRWVPLVFFGGGIRTQLITVAMSPADIVPTIARLLGIPAELTDGTAVPIDRLQRH